MNIALRTFLVAVCTLLVLPAQASGWLPKPVQVSSNTWAWIGPYEGPSAANRGYRMNMGFVRGANAIAVVDSGYSPEMAEEMLRRIRELTPLPVRYVVNTNSQAHRFMGNDVFHAAGAEIIASTEAAARMANEGAGFAATVARTLRQREDAIAAPKAPARLLDAGQAATLDLGGGVKLAVRHFGRAHTRGTLVVEVAPDATVFAGDILYGGRLPALIPDGHVGEWIKRYDGLRKLKARTFVPGHGEPGPLKRFEHATYAYLTAIKAHMDGAVEKGIGVGEAMASFDASPWRELANFEELAGRNASLAYLEAEAEGF